MSRPIAYTRLPGIPAQDVTAQLLGGWSAGGAWIGATGPLVTLRFHGLVTPQTGTQALIIPAAFAPALMAGRGPRGTLHTTGSTPVQARWFTTGNVLSVVASAGDVLYGDCTWTL